MPVSPNRAQQFIALFFFQPGSGTFILLAHLSRMWGGANHIRQKVQTGLVTAWGLRLVTQSFICLMEVLAKAAQGTNEHKLLKRG